MARQRHQHQQRQRMYKNNNQKQRAPNGLLFLLLLGLVAIGRSSFPSLFQEENGDRNVGGGGACCVSAFSNSIVAFQRPFRHRAIGIPDAAAAASMGFWIGWNKYRSRRGSSSLASSSVSWHPADEPSSHSPPPPPPMEPSSSSMASLGIPTILELQTDPFLLQVSHAEFVIGVLIPEDAGRQTDVLMRRLRAQLSHSDGRRGFMVTFLTSTTATIDSKEDVVDDIPSALVAVIVEQIQQEILSKIDTTANNNNSNPSSNSLSSSSSSEMIRLMYQNVVMPTAMISMHTDPELSVQSALTASKATRLLRAVYEYSSSSSSNTTPMKTNASNDDDNSNAVNALLLPDLILSPSRAIREVVSSSSVPGTDATTEPRPIEKTEYWTEFFARWGYQLQQRSDIDQAMADLFPNIILD